MNTQLFEVHLRVHLTPDHPKFGKFGFALLVVWLYASDHKSALEKAVVWIRPLPYEIGDVKSFAITEQPNLKAYQIEGVKKAEIIGRNLALFHWPKGTDESQVLGSWPGLVPILNLP